MADPFRIELIVTGIARFLATLSELSFERYLALGVLGRNLHVLGRLVLANQDALCEASKSLRRNQSAA